MPDHGLVRGGSGPAPGQGKHWVRTERWMAQRDPGAASSSETRFPHMQNGEDNILPHRAGDGSKKRKRKPFTNGTTVFKSGPSGIYIIQAH